MLIAGLITAVIVVFIVAAILNGMQATETKVEEAIPESRADRRRKEANKRKARTKIVSQMTTGNRRISRNAAKKVAKDKKGT